MLPWPHTTAGPLCAEAARKHLVPNRTAIWPQSESDSGQFQYDLKEAEEDRAVWPGQHLASSAESSRSPEVHGLWAPGQFCVARAAFSERRGVLAES